MDSAMSRKTALTHFNATRDNGSFLDKVRNATELQRQIQASEEDKPRRWTFGDVIHGAIGAALGAGVAKGISAVLGVSPRFADKLETAAMGVGAAMNTGVIKRSKAELEEAIPRMEQMRKHAFRVGFLLAASRDARLQKLGAMMPTPFVNLDPAGLFSVPRHVATSITGAGRSLGSLAGSVEAPDENDEEIAKMQVEHSLLQEQLERVRADRRNVLMKKLLAKRKR